MANTRETGDFKNAANFDEFIRYYAAHNIASIPGKLSVSLATLSTSLFPRLPPSRDREMLLQGCRAISRMLKIFLHPCISFSQHRENPLQNGLTLSRSREDVLHPCSKLFSPSK